MTVSSFIRGFGVMKTSRLDQPSSGRLIEQAFVCCHVGRTEGGNGEAVVCMPRARMKLEPAERLRLACRPHPAALLPALLRAIAAVLVTTTVLALLAHSSAPHGVRLALDLL